MRYDVHWSIRIPLNSEGSYERVSGKLVISKEQLEEIIRVLDFVF